MAQQLKKLTLGLILVLLVVPFFSVAYAGIIYDITIPSGSADPNSPFHWSSEKDGDTSGFIEIIVGEVIHWKNADTASHTVVSGNPQSGPDGIFDSGNLGPGDVFVHKFTEKGDFPYYCTIHPWMTGLVSVVSGNSFLPNVASDVGDGKTLFNLEYKFNRLLSSASVDEASKTISFELQGRSMSDDNTLTLFLPSNLISGISSVSIDGISTENFTQKFEDGLTLLVIADVPPTSKSITITGATIIPEFTDLVIIVLISSIAMIVLFSKKQTGSLMKLNYY
ncbi:MAG: PEFG-CTERM sorting domain-containing protein [Nitrosopumilus sp.]|nr:PEFG-CTERM sorting domain-containing protein [Nitrosopumilus sp.]MDH3385743.1 PEFG-CTERM sorting domain-containing protein [Nitrosopumilus sp.]